MTVNFFRCSQCIASYDALHFILGRHPGLNQASFAGGVGAQSTTVGYGFNRADWTYVPGGTVSGTALIRPDFPELLVFPFLWQQVECDGRRFLALHVPGPRGQGPA